MKISHETPLDLLDVSTTFNDYQYLLPHYWEKYPKYKEFFLKYRKTKDSFIIMDNGLFEGGVFPEEKLLEIINEIKPDIFIVPDAWNDFNVTWKNAIDWIDKAKFFPKETKLMVVAQGNYKNQLKWYFDLYERGIKHFAFNHSSIAYKSEYNHKDELISKTIGRIMVLDEILDEYTDDCYIHLLGVNLPQELIYMSDNIKNKINSIDTSNPILVGALGKKYGEMGINFKPTEKIEKFMEEDLSSKIENIIFNVGIFRSWAC
jgi:hypothetical protein